MPLTTSSHRHLLFPLLLLLLPLLLLSPVTAQQTPPTTTTSPCYDSNGSQVSSGVFENSKKTWQVCPGSQTCCLTGGESDDVCFSGGMCWSGSGGSFYRGMCAKQEWSSDSGCPGECLDLHNNGNTWINACGDNWCCAGGAGSGNDCCDDADAVFRHREYSPLIATNTSTQCFPGDQQVRAANQTGSGGITTAAATTLSAAEIPEGYIKQSIAIGIGAGLGVPLLCALAALAFLLSTSRRSPPKFHENFPATPDTTTTTPLNGSKYPSVVAASPPPPPPSAPSPQSRGDGYSYLSSSGEDYSQAGATTYTSFLEAGKTTPSYHPGSGSGSVQQRPMAEMYGGPERFEAPA